MDNGIADSVTAVKDIGTTGKDFFRSNSKEKVKHFVRCLSL